jgi:putative addiction module component (TIGR02574 family)
MAAIEKVLQDALALSTEDREVVAEALLRSLEREGEPAEDDWHPAWGAEIERRLEQLHDGAAKTYTHDEVMAHVARHFTKP